MTQLSRKDFTGVNVNGVVGAEDEHLAQHAQRHNGPVVGGPPDLQQNDGRVAHGGAQNGPDGKAFAADVTHSHQIQHCAGNLHQTCKHKIEEHVAAQNVHVQIKAVVYEAIDVEGSPENESGAAVLSTAQQIPNGGFFLLLVSVLLWIQLGRLARYGVLVQADQLLDFAINVLVVSAIAATGLPQQITRLCIPLVG